MLALNVYLAMCYHKLDYYDVSQEVLAGYVQNHPDSAIAINLKACNYYKLYNGKAAEVCWRDVVYHCDLHCNYIDIAPLQLSVIKTNDYRVGSDEQCTLMFNIGRFDVFTWFPPIEALL